MKLYYVTVDSDENAKKISLALLEKKLVACTNWFPITSAYRWEGEMRQEAEIVLILKTKENLRAEIEKVISEWISYTNFIAEIDVCSVNQPYLTWLNQEVI